MPEEFCPRCGQARIGMFRYCRSCGMDFDEVPVANEPPESQPPHGSTPRARPRRISRYIGLGIAVVVGLGALGTLTGSPSVTPGPSATGSSIAVAPSATSGSTPATSIASAPAGASQLGDRTQAQVVRVVDGDTIVVELDGTEQHVRYIGMDTPESVKPGSPVEAMALAATAANKALVDGRTVWLEKDVSDVDQFDRLLRDVWVERDGALVNVGLELVRTGFAQVTTFPPDVKYLDDLLAAQSEARSAAVGIWAEPSGATPPPQKPATPLPFIGDDCHPSYSKCLPIVDDLDCADIREMGKAPVTIKGPDDYRLDRDGDGLGCE